MRATGTADVVDTVNFARERNLLVAVRGGGHSVAGLSSCDGGVVIDLTRMRAVTVDPIARRASVQGGAVWADVDRETQAFGLVVPGGVVSETGVGGLTLGGGEGWVRRKYGLTVDSLRAATVVCADGSVHVASPDSDADLFWALRGGGGNFGVVTHFDFDAHPLGPIVAFAGVMYSTRDAGEILPRWRDHVTDAPDEVTSVAVAISMPADPGLPEAVHNQSCLVIGGVYVGDVDEGMRVLQPLRELGTPLADISGPTPFVGVNSAFDPFFPMGTYQSYWKAQNLDTLPDEALAVIAAKADSRPSPVTLAVVFQMGGAINRVGSADTAYSERTAQWMSSFDGNWENPDDNESNIGWVRGAFNRWPDTARGARTPTSPVKPMRPPTRSPVTPTGPTRPGFGRSRSNTIPTTSSESTRTSCRSRSGTTGSSYGAGDGEGHHSARHVDGLREPAQPQPRVLGRGRVLYARHRCAGGARWR